jgi:3-methylfumaryl-CoA hydratase
MWIGGRLAWTQPLVIGEETERQTRVASVERKTGRQGDFVLVTLRHELRQRGEVALTEEQDLAFRGAPVASPTPDSELPGDRVEGEVRHRIDTALLFRYSALTFNTHRIHYDLAYATEVEGYPALVVQAPLVATLLAGLCSDRTLATLDYRATAPAFAPGTLTLSRHDDGHRIELSARQDGVTTMRATAW